MMTKDELLEIIKKANTNNWNADDVYNALEETIKFLEQVDSKALHITDVSGSLPDKYCSKCGEPLARGKHKFWCEYNNNR